MTSGAERRNIGQPQPAQQPVELVGQRRRSARLDTHRRPPTRSAGSTSQEPRLGWAKGRGGRTAGLRSALRASSRAAWPASTSPARAPTAACADRAPPANAASPPRRRDASCAPNPDSPSRPASRAPCRRGSSRASARPAPRSSLRERIDPRPPPHRHRQPTPASVPGRHPVRNRLVITASERRRTTQRACRVERLKDLHHFLRSLQAGLPGTPRRQGVPSYRPIRTKPWGDPMATHGEIRWPPVGRSGGRLRGDSHGRRHPAVQQDPSIQTAPRTADAGSR
jgi:hypothetical protein